MLFYIVSAVAVILTIWAVIHFWGDFDSILGAIFGSIGIVLLGAFIWFLAIAALVGISNIFVGFDESHKNENTLTAVATKDTIEGKFSGNIFASYGYIDGKRVISYISQESDGAYVTGQIDAEDARIYEVNDKTPYIEETVYKKRNNWIIHAVIASESKYKIYVPEGSVVDGFEIAP